AAGGMASVSSASPLLYEQIVGWDRTTFTANGEATSAPPTAIVSGGVLQWKQSLPSVAVGDTIAYAILAYLAPTGTTNSQSGGITLNSKNNVTDGINSLNFDVFELATDQIQGSIQVGDPSRYVAADSGFTGTLPD